MAPDRSERLESWKEIAGYLGRSVRTVQRWERLEGLPVHRLVHDKLGNVYAHRSELDAWWEERRNRLEVAAEEEAPEPAASGSNGRRFAPLLVLAGLAVAGLLYWGGGRTRLPSPARLAVLPFANLTGDPEQEFLGDGLTEELTAELGRLPQLAVIARTSVMRFKKTDQGIDAIGRELKVDYVLEGSVRQADRRLRVTAQLIRVSDEAHVWAESFDRELTGLLGVQREIARRAAEETLLHTATPPPGRSVDAEAYVAYLRGRYHWNKRTEDGFKRGLLQFQQAIAKDPGFAPAYSGLADTYMLMGNYGHLPAAEAAALARPAADRALALDPELSDAHASLGLILRSSDWSFERAEAAFRRALELNPSHATARYWYALLLLDVERTAEARAQLQAGLETDPLSDALRGKLADCDYNDGLYDRALAARQAATEASPESPNTWGALGRLHLVLGRHDEALAALERARRLAKDDSELESVYVCALAGAGRTREARAAFERLVSASATRHVPIYDLAVAATGLGDHERALSWLTRVVDERQLAARFLARDRLLVPLRSDPRFRALVASVGNTLPE